MRRMPSPTVQTRFGHRVRELRVERGWSQEHLADVVGLDRSYIGGVERGERNISLGNICRIADGLDVTIRDLMDIDNG